MQHEFVWHMLYVALWHTIEQEKKTLICLISLKDYSRFKVIFSLNLILRWMIMRETLLDYK